MSSMNIGKHVRAFFSSVLAPMKDDHQASDVVDSEDQYWGRVSSYSVIKWPAKPAELSPLICARYGWENVKYNLLKCVSCRKIIFANLPNAWEDYYETALVKTVKQLISNHDCYCHWKYNPSPESFYNLPFQNGDDNIIVTYIRSALESLIIMDHIPKLDTSKIYNMQISDLKLIYAKYYEEIDVEHILHIKFGPREKAIVILAITGWCKRGTYNDIIECKYCQRHVGVWNFDCFVVKKRATANHTTDDVDGSSMSNQFFLRDTTSCNPFDTVVVLPSKHNNISDNSCNNTNINLSNMEHINKMTKKIKMSRDMISNSRIPSIVVTQNGCEHDGAVSKNENQFGTDLVKEGKLGMPDALNHVPINGSEMLPEASSSDVETNVNEHIKVNGIGIFDSLQETTLIQNMCTEIVYQLVEDVENHFQNHSEPNLNEPISFLNTQEHIEPIHEKQINGNLKRKFSETEPTEPKQINTVIYDDEICEETLDSNLDGGDGIINGLDPLSQHRSWCPWINNQSYYTFFKHLLIMAKQSQ